MPEKKKGRTLINISKKTFIEVTVLLLVLLVFSIVLTYVVPKGEFGVTAAGETDYLDYRRLDDQSGIPIWQGLLAPILVFGSSDGVKLIVLSLFLFVISAAFQVMNDVGGIRALVGSVSERFRERKKLLLVLIALLFYCFGSFLGLFEEMLTMLPIVTALCLMIGFDSFTGFIVCILSCGFGFAGAITNPFTVMLASEIIDANPMEHIWFRIVIFAVMFLLLLAYLFLYLRKIGADPTCSLTYERDRVLRESADALQEDGSLDERDAGRIRIAYSVFLLVSLALIILCSSIKALQDYTVIVLIAYFLIFGIVTGCIACGKLRTVLKSFLSGLTGALPTIVFIALAASIKYVFDRGAVLPTIVNQINELIAGHSIFGVALVIYLIVLLLEFFISSSTAKAILVMGLLAMVSTGLSKQMLVLLYTFGDGYTNVLFPTSPVLLISLSMIEVDYFTWIKKSAPLFLVNFLLVIGFICLGIVVGY